MPTKIIKNFFLILIFLIIGTYCSFEKHYKNAENLPLGPPDIDNNNKRPDTPSKDPIDIDEDKFKKEVEAKIKENLLLKEEIENKLKYIKILLVTGVIMLLIIIAILIKSCFCKKKKKIKPTESNIVELPDAKKNQRNSIPENDGIEESSYNILNNSLKNSSNISLNDANIQNNLSNDNKNINEENANNLNSNKIDELFKESVNDENKTLTNNPDIFIQSKTDKILYQPYSNEEIYNSDKK